MADVIYGGHSIIDQTHEEIPQRFLTKENADKSFIFLIFNRNLYYKINCSRRAPTTMKKDDLDVEDSDDKMEYHEWETKVVSLKANMQKPTILKSQKRGF